METDKTFPGQTIEYVLVYSNISDEPLTEVKMIGPIPEATEYIANTASEVPGVTKEFSIDKGISYSPEPIKYMKKLDDGTEEEAIATPDMYTHIRWSKAVFEPNSNVEFRYRVKVK